MNSSSLRLFGVGFLVAVALATVNAQNQADPLKSGFENPPASARPRVWWHWMNGNISKEGIKLDLEWMHRVGIAGFHNFDAALATPQVVDHRLAYMTPEWKDAFKYATTLADQFGMEEAIAGSPGWSETGGPWVPPAEAMKKYVWSETEVEGGRPFHGIVAHPPSNTGAFQNLPNHDLTLGGPSPVDPVHYADSAVVAYRLPEDDISIASLHPKVTTSAAPGVPIDASALSDGDYIHGISIAPAEVGQKSWLLYEFEKPVRIQAISLEMGGPYDAMQIFKGYGESGRDLESSDDGQTFREIVHIENGAVGTTTAFTPVTARFFRITFLIKAPEPNPFADLDASAASSADSGKVPPLEVGELVLHTGARVNRYQEKAAFAPMPDLYKFATVPVSASEAIDKNSVIDLTGKMQSDGSLDWNLPPGRWVIVRLGYSLLGIRNHPATLEATGLEVDKLNGHYVRHYMDQYLDTYRDTVGPDLMGKRGIRFVVTDSWEAGAQNWTDDMITQFKKYRGYDPVPWIPVLTGHIVESSDASDRFLWDLRKTIADLTSDEHYKQVEESIHARGLGHYGESHESGRAFVADGMEVKKFNEVPMSAMWTQTPGVNHEQFGYNADDRESASVAHIYGQNLAAAESMTAAAAPWGWSPATLKPTADQEFLNGINRIVIHESTHQPLVGKAPGLTLGPFGQWFNRNETWAEQAGPWIDYLARTSFLLQQGHFAADLIYFYGEDSNLTAIFDHKAPDVPPGYGFDYVNADALIHELKASNGVITTPGGMSYRLLGLDPYSRHMSLPVLRAIHKLVMDGAAVAGPKPTDDPSLADDGAEFNRLNEELFGNGTGIHTVGKGTVYAGQELADVFQAMNVAKDFDYTRRSPETRLEFVHRKLTDGDLYFVDNRGDDAVNVDATFRIAGKAPELWYAESGSSNPASYTIAKGRTTVPLKLDPWGTVFVVFREPASAASRIVPVETEKQLATLDGPWSLSFQPGRGAPSSISLDKLSAWNESPESGVRYFSGVGTYTKTINAPAAWFAKGSHLWIDLGDVKNLAEVELNGRPLGIVWHAPYRVSATGAFKAGANQLTVKVVNSWVNRLIGDEQPGATRITFADVKPYKANSPLQPSGLLGPVEVLLATGK
jgi:hypothetical protein